MEQIRIACIGAHPDDIELSMGGTVMKMVAAGHKVTLVDLTNGEPTPCGTVEIRQQESSQAASLLGIERITLNLPNRYLFDSVEARKKLAEVFRTIRPRFLFTHYEYDDHPDHKAACQIVEAARFYSKLTKSEIQGEPHYPEKIFYFFPNHINLNILPAFTVDISRYFERKKQVLECYQSQFIKKGKGRFIEETLNVNRYHGSRIHKTAAEPFYIRDALDIEETARLFTSNE